MSLDIKGGSLSRRIKFYAPKDGVSTFRSIDDYDLLRECWAYIEQVSARSQIYAGIEVQDGQYTISVRYFHGLHIIPDKFNTTEVCKRTNYCKLSL